MDRSQSLAEALDSTASMSTRSMFPPTLPRPSSTVPKPPPRAPPPSSAATSTVSVIGFKMDRLAKDSRNDLKALLSEGDRAGYERSKGQMAQLAEWRRQRADGGGVDEAILALIESVAASRSGEGLLTPRTDDVRDAPAWERNTGLRELLRLHAAAEARLQRGTALPMRASEAQAAAASKATHAGPRVPNDAASDVSALPVGAAPLSGEGWLAPHSPAHAGDAAASPPYPWTWCSCC